MHAVARWLVAFVLMGLLGAGPAQAAGERPLLMAGKQSLYQRVLAKPRAELRRAPDRASEGRAVVPFTVYYVYERREAGGAQWLHVGTDSHGSTSGWLAAKQTIEWNQALTVAFREPVGTDRVLLFRDRDSLQSLVEHRSAGIERYQTLYEQALDGQPPADSPVVAIQPGHHIDIREDFYLVPIKRHQDMFLGSEQARLLEVATVPLATPQGGPADDAAYRSGLVFVTDSTVSMQPYIERTREVMRRVYAAIDEAGLNDKVNFGLTAYRDNVEAAPGLAYLTWSFLALDQGGRAGPFLEQIDRIATAPVSSRDFQEDAYAGVRFALETTDWSAFDARYLVLITDASARDAGDPLSSTGMNAETLRQLARDKGVAIWVMHLRTPEGTEDHARAEAQYRALSSYAGIGEFYYGVPTGDVAEFGRVLEALTRQITEQVRATAAGEPPLPIAERPAGGAQLTEFQERVEMLGYALRMRYLERAGEAGVPEVFDAWMIDRDFRRPERPTLDVHVLLTRDQLSDLQNVLRQVLDTAEEGVLSPDSFLNDLKSMAATLSRDPAGVGASTRAAGGENLADLGYLREYIEDLPYQGQVMSVSLQDWEDWSAKRQLEFVHGLESKISYYQALHDHTDLWIALDGGGVDGDSVYPIPLSMLP
ncbi:MAG: hypothetical protein PVI15_00705 [Chromatiales bacterium]|jgi:hypothetical protein